jgi:hypothetical protein
VNLILEQLLALTGRLKAQSGVPADALESLRLQLAASLIQQNPASLPIIRDPALDPAINDAAIAGVTLATQLTQAGTRFRVIRDSYLTPAVTPDRPREVLGPFVDADGSLVRFAVFENTRFLAVHLAIFVPFPLPQEALILLPLETSTNDGNQTFTIPAGTVWLRARFLVGNSPGYAGLRVKGGSLRFDRPALPIPGRRLAVASNNQWRLTLEPEQPEAGDANGSDADALIVGLPTSLEVRSTGAPSVSGALSMTGFGSDLEFANPAGGPNTDLTSIVFPFDDAGAVWSIASNRSAAAQLSGESRVTSAAWTLPVTNVPLNTFGEATHGGSLRLRLHEQFECRLRGASSVFKCLNTRLTANGKGVEVDLRQVTSSARVELDLWTPAQTDAVFAQQPIARFLFSSLRNGPDVALVSGGQLVNRWDLPLTAAGKPFPYQGQIEGFAVIAELTGLLRIACSAIQQPEIRTEGVTLENLYLMVRPPRKLAFTGDYDGASLMSAGTAVFFFDVLLAQPSLPDPYVANWSLPDSRFTGGAALSITMRWANAQTPGFEAQLERPVDFPQPENLPADEPRELRNVFDRYLGSRFESLSLLDLSSNDHQFGVALESLADRPVRIAENRLTVPLREVRLLMQPQVQWEPVQIEPNADAKVLADRLNFTTNGARTLVGTSSVRLVPVLPGVVGMQIAKANADNEPAGALFSLPFGLRAFVRMDPLFENVFGAVRPVVALINEPGFGDLTSAQQFRLIATGGNGFGFLNPARTMPGSMKILPNVSQPNKNLLKSMLPLDVETMLFDAFESEVPLHHADLSGYGLSTFSNWRKDVPVGITKVRFDVLSGRTSYEVIQARTVLAFCISHVVRTIIFERRNSGKVLRFDSGWQPVDDGEFKQQSKASPLDPQKNFEFEKGVLKAFRNIRRIRVLNTPRLIIPPAPGVPGSEWQQVIFDADAHLENVVAGGAGQRVPILDHVGYIQIRPSAPKDLDPEPTRDRIVALFKQIGAMVGGPIDGKIRVGGTLEMNLAGIFADEAPNDNASNIALMVAAYGSPKLPRAGQWTAVRINGSTFEASPVDPRHGMPVIRRTGQPYTFREPGDANRSKPDEFGFLMTTPTSRVLFPQPTVAPGVPGVLITEPGVLKTKPASIADPYSLVQSSSSFPRATYTRRCDAEPVFNISADNEWRLTNPNFKYKPPAPDLVKGGEWAITRPPPAVLDVNVLLDSATQNKPWEIASAPNELKIDIDPFTDLFRIVTNYHAVSGDLPKLEKPSLAFGNDLQDVKEIINSLGLFMDLGFDFDVDVTTRNGPSPSFLISLSLKFLIGKPTERIDIGIGKFSGEFLVRGELETTLSGKTHGLLSAEFQGDIQQGIIPPAIYAGGFFRFALTIPETGRPIIELGLATVTSLGGDLIKGLLEVEVTIKYGYTLIPLTLEPGVLLGLEARAKLLGGLVGFSFSVQAIARIKRISLVDNKIDIWAKIRVAASVQVAWLIDEDVDFETQFEQRLPLALVAAAAFGPALAPIAALL